MSRAHEIPTLLRLLLLSCASSAAHGPLPAPEDLRISIPVFGIIAVTWKHVEAPANNSVEYWVQIRTPYEVCKKIMKPNTTSSDQVSLHDGVNVRVAAILLTALDLPLAEEDLNWTSKDLPPSGGENGTAAEQLQCQIFINAQEGSLLSCDWLSGHKAPSDTQYHLYYRWKETAEHCPQYVTEAGGRRHKGCRAPLQNKPSTIWILVNGSSASQKIKPAVRQFRNTEIEVLPPVQNFSRTRDGFRWEQPSQLYPDYCFVYEVNCWSKDKNFTVTVGRTNYWNENLKEPASETHVRVRGIGKDPCWDSSRISGPWSEAIAIEAKKGDLLWLTLSISLFVVCLALFLLFIRYWRSLFPQIPKPKDDLKEVFKHAQTQALMRCNSWDTEEVISYLEVMTPPSKPYKLPLDYTEITD